tara:strand:- start:62 stop:226 length:165 start_codon:yes stop_codon:yes gene_type:complete
MGKGSKRRTGEDIKNIVSNWDEINWGCIKQTQDEETNKNKDDRKELNDNDNRRD